MPAIRAILRWQVIAIVATALLGCDNKTALEHLSSANENVANGEPRVAIIELKNAIQKDASLGAARSLLGQLHYQAGDLASALKELERAIDLGVADETTQLFLLRTKNALGRYTEVVGELEESSRLTPEFAVVLAAAYIEVGDIVKAKPLLQQGQHLPGGLFGMARVAQAESDPELAYGYLERLVEQHPEMRDGWLFKGELELAQGESSTALASFGQARRLPGGDISGQLGVIRAHLLGENLAAAQSEVDALIVRASDFPPAQYLKGLISFKQNDLESAEAALRVVQQHARDHLPTLYLMGAVKAQQGQLNQAEDNLRRYLAQDVNNVSVRKLLATIYNEQGKVDEVLAVLQPASEQNADPQLWAMLGAAQLRSDNMAEATRSFQQAVNLAPDMAPFRNQLALSLLSTGQDEQAIAQLSSAVELDGDQFQSDYILVMLKLRDRDYPGAAEAVDKLIAKSGDVPIGYNLKGAIALAQKDVATATEAFERSLALDASYFPAAKNLAQLAEQSGDTEQARKYYQGVLAANQDSESATLALVDLAVREGDSETGLALLADAVDRFPRSVRARIGQLRLFAATGQLQEAEQAAQAAYELAPEVPDILLMKAEIDLRTGDLNEARQMAGKLQGVIDRFKGNKNLLAAAGALQLKLGNLSVARSNLEQATIGDQVPVNALTSLARLELVDGNPQAAQTQLDRLIEQGISGEEIELLVGDTLAATGKEIEALQHFRTMAAAGSRQGTSRYSLLALRQGDLAEARESLQTWLSEHPEDRGIQLLLANVQIQAGQEDVAKSQYESMLPTNNPVVLNNLAWIYLGEGDDRALAMAKEANAAAPNNPDIEDTLGWILVSAGSMDEGLELLRSSARARPDNASVLYHLGVAYQGTGDIEAARQSLERALSLGEFDEAEAAERALADL